MMVLAALLVAPRRILPCGNWHCLCFGYSLQGRETRGPAQQREFYSFAKAVNIRTEESGHPEDEVCSVSESVSMAEDMGESKNRTNLPAFMYLQSSCCLVVRAGRRRMLAGRVSENIETGSIFDPWYTASS